MRNLHDIVIRPNVDLTNVPKAEFDRHHVVLARPKLIPEKKYEDHTDNDRNEQQNTDPKLKAAIDYSENDEIRPIHEMLRHIFTRELLMH